MAENFGMTFSELKEKGYAHKPITYRKHESNGKGFDTETGKIELYSLALEKLGYAPLPFYAEPPESPVSDPETAREFPDVLTSGARVANYFTSEVSADPQTQIQPSRPARRAAPGHSRETLHRGRRVDLD